MRLVGSPPESIAEDYALTTVGRYPEREKIMARLSQFELFSDTAAARNMLECRSVIRRYSNAHLILCRWETMIAFLQMLDDEFGGVEMYLTKYCGLTDEDLKTIKCNLTSAQSARY